VHVEIMAFGMELQLEENAVHSKWLLNNAAGLRSSLKMLRPRTELLVNGMLAVANLLADVAVYCK
jgi:hypothetical protein